MAVPKFFEFFEEFLKSVQDGKVHTAREVRERIAVNMKLTDADRAEMLPSGKQRTFDNRVAWARIYLDRAGLIETPIRGKYCITENGRKALASGAEIDLKYLERSEKFRAFYSVSTEDMKESDEEEKDESPMETLETAFQQINAALASQLMDEVMELTSTEFEKLVVKLLLQMGYGSVMMAA